MNKLIEQLKALIGSYEDLNRTLEYARYHIKNHLRDFPPKELECMAMDGIIEHKDIPEDLRTEHSKRMAEHCP